MALPQACRFFLVVPVVSNAMLGAFALFTLAGCAAVMADVGYAAGALAPLLLLQLFAAASGFRVPARRGHYDLLLTSGEGRVAIALAHWLMSIWPGLLAWAALAATEQAAGGRALVAPGTLVALAITSTLSWSVTVPLPRLSGAIVLLLVFVTLGTMAGGARAPASAPATLLPWAFVGRPLQGADALAGGAIVLLALGLVALAVGWIRGMNVPLESAQ